MFRNVPGCSGMFHVPGFVDAQFKAGVLNFFGYKIERQSSRFAICYLKNSVT